MSKTILTTSCKCEKRNHLGTYEIQFFVAGRNVFRFIERPMTKEQAGTVPDGANVLRTSANNPCLPVGLGDMFSG